MFSQSREVFNPRGVRSRLIWGWRSLNHARRKHVRIDHPDLITNTHIGTYTHKYILWVHRHTQRRNVPEHCYLRLQLQDGKPAEWNRCHLQDATSLEGQAESRMNLSVYYRAIGSQVSWRASCVFAVLSSVFLAFFLFLWLTFRDLLWVRRKKGREEWAATWTRLTNERDLIIDAYPNQEGATGTLTPSHTSSSCYVCVCNNHRCVQWNMCY